MVKKTQLPRHIVDAALTVAAESGWHRVSLADIAVQAKLPLPEVYAHFPSKIDILEAWFDHLDHAMMAGEIESEASHRDRLFDVVMRRLDAMTPHKEAVRRLAREGGGDPVTALCGMRRMQRSLALMLEAAGIPTSGLGGLARVEGMGFVYAYTLRAWLRDDSADLSRTMAALDKALRRAEGLAALIWRGRRAIPSGEGAPSVRE
jgi:AcrR family transcriptional regulator